MLVLLLSLWFALTAGLWLARRRGAISRDYHRDLLALGVLAVALGAFFWRMLSNPDLWMPVGGGDLVSFLYPIYAHIGRSLESGSMPLWNPYLYGGAPFVGDNQSALLYPLNWLFVLASPVTYRGMELWVVTQFYLAGVCAYFGLRHLHREALNRWAALVGAIAFMFSDLFVTHFGNLNMIACAAWLPLAFCLFSRAVSEGRVGLAAGAGGVLGFAALAGHAQPLLYIGLALGLYVVYEAYRLRQDSLRLWLSRSLALLLALLVAFGVAAPALLPSYEMSQLTSRVDLTYDQAIQYSLPPAALVGLLAPGVFGRGPGGHWAPWARVEVGYVGVLTLVLAALAVLLRRDRLTRFFVILGAVGLLAAMGGYAIVHGWLYQLVPGLDMVRAPARMVYLLDFALAALAALGLDALMHPIPLRVRAAWRQALRLLAVILLGLCLVVLPLGFAVLLSYSGGAADLFSRLLSAMDALVLAAIFAAGSVALVRWRGARKVGRATLGALCLGWLLVDLASLGAYSDLERNDPTLGFDHPEAVAFLKSDAEYYRIDTRTEVWDVWQPNLSLLYGIHDVWGIHNPLVLADYERYWEGLGSRSGRLYDFLNAKYIIGHKDVVLDWDKFELAFDGDPLVNVYRNTRVLPRAFVVYEAWSVNGHEDAFAAIHRDEFDPSAMVVVEQGRALSAAGLASSEAHIVEFGANALTVHVEARAAGYLVLSEVFYPGWEATVDGASTQIERANYAFRAVYLPEGSHEVRFRYTPSTWRWGVLACLLTWASLTGAALLKFASPLLASARKG